MKRERIRGAVEAAATEAGIDPSLFNLKRIPSQLEFTAIINGKPVTLRVPVGIARDELLPRIRALKVRCRDALGQVDLEDAIKERA